MRVDYDDPGAGQAPANDGAASGEGRNDGDDGDE
jgi:hypothetical protein